MVGVYDVDVRWTQLRHRHVIRKELGRFSDAELVVFVDILDPWGAKEIILTCENLCRTFCFDTLWSTPRFTVIDVVLINGLLDLASPLNIIVLILCDNIKLDAEAVINHPLCICCSQTDNLMLYIYLFFFLVCLFVYLSSIGMSKDTMRLGLCNLLCAQKLSGFRFRTEAEKSRVYVELMISSTI